MGRRRRRKWKRLILCGRHISNFLLNCLRMEETSSYVNNIKEQRCTATIKLP